jgi:hypothetical protein
MGSLFAAAEVWYARVRIVSLDVAAAALGGGLLAVRVIGSSPRPAFYLLLPAGVWVAYTADHLLDALRMGPAARTPRHRFHFCHAGSLWTAVVLVSIASAVGGWFGLSGFGLVYAAAMCALVAGHELIVKLAGSRASPLLVKELGVAVVFTAGVWGMPWLRHGLDTGRWFDWPVLLMFQYLLLAIANLVEFSIYESKIDTADGQTSFVRGIGRSPARRVVIAVLTAVWPVGIAAVWLNPSRIVVTSEGIFLLMAIGLWWVLAVPRIAARAERYRTVGDGVFLLPLLLALVR